MRSKDNTHPIHITSSFHFEDVAAMRAHLQHEMTTPFYTRGYNPTVAALRVEIAKLEGAQDALVFGSGSAAVAMAIMSVAKAGDHIVCVNKPYSWTKHLLANYLPKYGVTTTFVDGKNPENFAAAAQENTVLFYLETPNSMTFELQDVAAISAIAKGKNILVAIDNSHASPINQQPLALGADLVIHSATKYLNGHHDVVAGAVCGSTELIQNMMREEFMTLGGILGPQEAWLILRGLRTLKLRMAAHETNVKAVYQFLKTRPEIAKINYPFAEDFAQLDLANRQMKGAGSLLSIELKTDDMGKIERFCDGLKHFIMGPSWGGFESIQFPACVLYNSANYGTTTLPKNLVRLFIGLEDPEIIIADLRQALEGL